MAVIREKRQFQIGPIGVARASQSGRVVGDAISRSANILGDMFYREAAAEAEKAGTEAAQSVDREQVITINPETGEPEAYAAPAGMGSIGTDAYQRVVMRRFQQSIEDEIRNKGKEIAVRYENSANGVALYESAMSDYLASMTNVAQDQFKGFITDVGTTYLNATTTNMRVAQVKRERIVARRSQEAAVSDGLQNIEAMVAQMGPAALNGPTVTNGVIQSVSATNSDGGKAGLFSPSEVNGHDSATRLAITRGLVRHASQQSDDPDTLRLLQQAIGTQNPNAVPDEFSAVADAMRGFGSDYSGLAKLEQFSDGLLGDQVQYTEVVQRRETEAQKAEDALTVFDMQNDVAGLTLSAKAFSVNRGPLAVANRSRDDWSAFTERARSQLAAGDKAISDQTLEERDAVLEAQASGLYARALSGLSTDDTDALENAIANRNPMLAPESARLELNALMRMEAATGQPILENFMPEISSYRSSAGKNVDSINQVAASQQALEVDLRSILYAEDVEGTLGERVSQINSIENLKDNERQAMISSAYLNAGTNNLNTFFANGSLNEDQLREARSVFEGGSFQTGVLSNAQVDQINQARAYAQDAGKLSQLRTTFNSQVGTVNSRIKAQEEATQASLQKASIEMGQASPTIKSDREVYEEMLSDKYANGQDISALWGSTESVTNPVALNILNDVTQKGVLPQSLHNTLTSLAEGEFRIGNPNAVLSHYMNVRDYQFEGQSINNRAINSLSQAQIAMLNYLADVVDVEGNISGDKMAAIYNQKVEFDRNPTKQESVKQLLDAPLEEFVLSLDGMKEAPYSAVSAIASATLSLASMGASRREIKRRLEDQMERTYPDGQGYVVNPNGGERTKFSLGQVAQGNEKLFKNHVRDIVSRTTNLTNFSFGGDLVRATTGRPGFIPAEDTVYLVPLDESSNGEVRYLVKRMRPLEEGGDEVLNGTFAEGETSYTAPVIISNRDSEFTDAVRNVQLIQQSQEIKKAKEAEAFSGTGRGSFLGTIFGTND